MAWWCHGCGQPRGGTMCKKWCREKYGNVGAEQIPRLDGYLFFNDGGSGIPRWEIRRKEELRPFRYVLKSVRGPRPQGWKQAMGAIGQRAAALLAGGLKVTEC